LTVLTIDQALTRAKSHRERGEVEDARHLLEAVLEAFPNHSEARKDLEGVKALLRCGDNLNPPQEVIDRVLSIYNSGQLLSAFEEAKVLTTDYPGAFVIWNIMGAAAAQLEMLDEAINAFEKVISLKPDYADGYNNLGNALKMQGKSNEAIKAYTRALEINPAYAENHFKIGTILKNQGYLVEATASYTRALELKPDYVEAQTNLGVVLENQGLPDEALVAYRKALEINPNYAEAHNNIGSIFKTQGQLTVAIEAFKKAVEINPNFAYAFRNLGISLRESGRYNEAVQSFKRALAIEPKFEEVQHLLHAITNITPDSAPTGYVEGLFDYYASGFEHSLVSKLNYQAPKLLTEIMLKQNPTESFGKVADLGCGTGLFGQEVHTMCESLVGIDVSQAMLREAKKKNVYKELVHCEIVKYLDSEVLNFDYFLASDVFVYVGNLIEVFQLIKSKNQRRGRLVFSTEHSEEHGFHLKETGRYVHSKSYISELCDKLELKISHFSLIQLRKERDNFIVGGLYILDF